MSPIDLFLITNTLEKELGATEKHKFLTFLSQHPQLKSLPKEKVIDAYEQYVTSPPVLIEEILKDFQKELSGSGLVIPTPFFVKINSQLMLPVLTIRKVMKPPLSDSFDETSFAE